VRAQHHPAARQLALRPRPCPPHPPPPPPPANTHTHTRVWARTYKTYSFRPERQQLLQEYDAVAGSSGAGDAEMDDDEELMMVGNVEKNERCPYTRKDVSAGRGHGGGGQCVAAATHIVSVGCAARVCVSRGPTSR
jgi:hypothetical protein